MTRPVCPQVPLLMAPPPPPPFPPPPLLAARHSLEDGRRGGPGLGDPTGEYTSPGRTGLGRGCWEWALLASPPRSFEAAGGRWEAADSRQLGTQDTEDRAGTTPSHKPAPQLFQDSLIVLLPF